MNPKSMVLEMYFVFQRRFTKSAFNASVQLKVEEMLSPKLPRQIIRSPEFIDAFIDR